MLHVLLVLNKMVMWSPFFSAFLPPSLLLIPIKVDKMYILVWDRVSLCYPGLFQTRVQVTLLLQICHLAWDYKGVSLHLTSLTCSLVILELGVHYHWAFFILFWHRVLLCCLDWPCICDLSASASPIAAITSIYHCAWLYWFVFQVEILFLT